jgi:Transposase IS116/IS110/IS902 family./Transposase.
MRKKSPKYKNGKKRISVDQAWPLINPNAAGVDLGSREHWVAVPADRAQQNVRCFGTFTSDLEALADWLKACGVTSVAMEATGVYWIPLFQLLERRGFAVLLVNARQIKNVSGRKSDVLDCQWIQRLHTYGLLGGSFRPADPYCVVRSYLRYRDELVTARSTQTQHMQKALQQMNLQLNQVLSDVNGLSGLAIIEAILQGQRNPLQLAALADRRVKSTQSQIAKALIGDYRAEHLFQLQTAFDLYHTYEAKIATCDEELARVLVKLPDRVDVKLKPLPDKTGRKKMDEDLRLGLYLKLGIDLTAIEGIGPLVALTVLTEVGPDLSRFKTEKHFTSWLGLCPDNRISGGKVLSCRTRRVVNRLSDVLRLAATTLERSQTALGAYYRRMKAKLGAAEGITAMAHKLARILYRLLTHGEAYVRQGMADYEEKYQARKLKSLKKIAESIGFELIQKQTVAEVVS